MLEDYSPGAEIIREGEEGHSMYIMWSGKASAYICGQDGNEMRVASYRDGDWFGEMALLKDVKRAATIRCDDFVKVLCLHRNYFNVMRPSARRSMQTLGFIRYAEPQQAKRAYRQLVMQLLLKFVFALGAWPLAAVWLLIRNVSRFACLCITT